MHAGFGGRLRGKGPKRNLAAQPTLPYISTWEGWLFLATVIDCHTKAVIGWAVDDNYKTPLIQQAIEMAARNYPLAEGAVFHSDRGSNYTSCEFARTLKMHNLRQSVGRGWLFLATVIDCHTKAVIGWATDDNYKTPLIEKAIEMAARNYPLAEGAVFHSDRGSNYTSCEFAVTLKKYGLRQSVGRTGICYEVSRRRGSHPPPLSEPCVTVSRYTAPVVEPVGNAPCRQWANMPG